MNYKISGELQLQLFDVLSEQPEGSQWKALYERMAERCDDFAARGAFGAESELAAQYRAMGRGSYLGDADRGRVDGNLFLVFWVGNMVGSRDSKAPDGDQRFFKEKLDELPGNWWRKCSGGTRGTLCGWRGGCFRAANRTRIQVNLRQSRDRYGREPRDWKSHCRGICARRCDYCYLRAQAGVARRVAEEIGKNAVPIACHVGKPEELHGWSIKSPSITDASTSWSTTPRPTWRRGIASQSTTGSSTK